MIPSFIFTTKLTLRRAWPAAVFFCKTPIGQSGFILPAVFDPDMKKIVSLPLAIYGATLLLCATVLLHLLLLFGLLPQTIVWGGHVAADARFFVAEIFSILLNVVFLAVVFSVAGWLRLPFNHHKLKVILYGMGVLFLLNTAGNLLAAHPVERWLFTPVTILLSLFCFRMALSTGEKLKAAAPFARQSRS